MRYGIMCVLAAAVMVAVAARPAPAADSGAASTDIRLAVAAGGHHGENGIAVQQVQYRRGPAVGVYVAPAPRGYYRGPVSPYRGGYYPHPYGRGYYSPYWGPHGRGYYHGGGGFYLRTPGVGIGIGW